MNRILLLTALNCILWITTAVNGQDAMPAARTITDTQGRSMEGTILNKTDTSIKFRRTSDNREFEIKLDTLSEADRAFIAGLVAGKEPELGADPNKKPVLVLVHNAATYKYPDYSDTVQWLKKAGFDVTIGLFHNADTVPESLLKHLEIPAEEKTIAVNEIGDANLFDLIWIPKFDPSVNTGEAETKAGRPNYFTITNQQENKKGGIVIRCEPTLANKRYFDQGFTGKRKFFPGESNYIRSTDNWVFYADNIEAEKTEKTRKELLDKVSELKK